MLEDREVQRVGATHSIDVDVRVVAATNQDLEQAIATRAFRADLYYRLSVFPICIPPLRERRDDIQELARYFALHLSIKLRKNIQSVSPAALERLQAYDWPGNVRELQNVIERAVILARGSTIDADAITLAAEHQHPVAESQPVKVVTLAEAER